MGLEVGCSAGVGCVVCVWGIVVWGGNVELAVFLGEFCVEWGVG